MVGNALTFIISVLFDGYIFILILRLLLQKFGANFYNPVIQFIYNITEPVLKPLRRFIPGFKGIDYASVVLLLMLSFVEMIFLLWLRVGVFPNITGVMVATIGSLGNQFLNVFFYATIAAVIISWIPTLQHNPLAELATLLAEPVFRPFRRIIPVIGGVDLSSFIAIIAIKVVAILVFYPLINYGIRVAIS